MSGAKQFWGGFATGAVAVVGGAWAFGLLGRGGSSRIVRLEKSVQIGRSKDDVFRTWCDLERLPQFSSIIQNVRRWGDRSHWMVNVGGQPFEWDAEIVQVIPQQAIGWKSISGAKHSGRITFAEIGNDTLVHVQMNFAPKFWLLRPAVSPMAGTIEGYIEQVLRDFKAAMESGKGIKAAPQQEEPTAPAQATGTYGPVGTNQRFGGGSNPVEFTRPPEAKR